MGATYGPLFVLVVGVVTGVSGLLRAPALAGKSHWVKAVFYSSILLPVLMQVAQYANVPTRTQRERDAAIALYAFAQDTQADTTGSTNTALLKLAARGNPDIDPNFFLGYAAFRAKRYEDAQQYLRAAVDKNRFRAPSEYLLGTMERFSEEAKAKPNYSEASGYMARSIADDKKYMAPRYGQAILYVKTGDDDDAWKDLQIAADGLAEACYDMNDPTEVLDLWKSVESRRPEEFGKLQKDCKLKFDAEAVAQ